MSNQSLGNRVQAALKAAVESGRLPDAAQDKAESLLARLQKPVRLGVLGMPQSGKSTLLNLLVGSDILPEGLPFPTLQLSHGDTPTAVCTLPDGSKKTIDGADATAISALSPVYVEMKQPLPALGKISVLEMVAPADGGALQKASQWAAKRCDVVLWCTQSFSTVERDIWAQLPDLIKDHGFLMVTKADALEDEGVLDQTMTNLRATARDDFHQILPIATLSAIASRQPDGTVNKDKMRGSGGLALISAVLKHVDMGRQSAVDMADVLLAQHADVLGGQDQEAAPAAPEPTPAPVKEDVAVAAPEPEPTPPAAAPEAAVAMPPPMNDAAPARSAESPAMSRLRAIAEKKSEASKSAKAAAETAPAPEAPAPQPAAVEGLTSATRDAYQHVVAYLEEQGTVLSNIMQSSGEDAPAKIMDTTVEQIQWLTDYLNENGDDSDTSLQRARDTAFDAADLVQLMQMEKRDSAALEAVALMLQIKRELQADLAA